MLNLWLKNSAWLDKEANFDFKSEAKLWRLKYAFDKWKIQVSGL